MVQQLQQTPPLPGHSDKVKGRNKTYLSAHWSKYDLDFTALIIDSDDAYGTSLSKAQVWLNSTISMWLETPTRKGKLAKTPPSKQTCGFLSNI